MTSRKKAKLIAQLALDKKAEDVSVMDMRKVVNFCDFFVLCTGTSDRHVRAIADGIEEGLNKEGVAIRFREGGKQSSWIIFDLGDVVVHMFLRDVREFYGLDHLWQDAKLLPLDK